MTFVTLECACGVRLDKLHLVPRNPFSQIVQKMVGFGAEAPAEVELVAASAGSPEGARRRRAAKDGNRVTLSTYKAATADTRHLPDPLGDDRSGPLRVACRSCGHRWTFDRIRLTERLQAAEAAGRSRLVAGLDL